MDFDGLGDEDGSLFADSDPKWSGAGLSEIGARILPLECVTVATLNVFVFGSTNLE